MKTPVISNVQYILCNYFNTRNSDKELYLAYAREYFPKIKDFESLIMNMPDFASLKRYRATIQNEWNMFTASPEVKAKRLNCSEEVKNEMISLTKKGQKEVEMTWIWKLFNKLLFK